MNSNLTSCRPLTSIVSYPERGEGGNNKYRGNCSPKLIEDLHSGFDLLNSDIPERPSFVFWHPPYWNMCALFLYNRLGNEE